MISVCDNASDVAGHFSRAADYSNHDVLQRLTAARLKSYASLTGRLLDLGAGPGTRFDGQAIERVIGVDLAFGMCERLKSRFAQQDAVCGDARQLPFQTASFDSLYSNLALQWCQPFTQAIDEAARVLRTGGNAAIAVVCDGSLPELEQLGFSVNHFIDASSALSAFEAGTWQMRRSELVTETVHFSDLRSLIYSIKGVGANARQDAGQAAKLRGRQDWLARLAAAETLRTEAGLPLSYQVLYVLAQRQQETL
ncbi:methyltransferase domain-containing protein [Shewanella sp.]|uniref:methyltransferase domain-containing protein n=1 Tax=Shewanella sp. TaxID=50422 RepID=UPI003563654B